MESSSVSSFIESVSLECRTESHETLEAERAICDKIGCCGGRRKLSGSEFRLPINSSPSTSSFLDEASVSNRADLPPSPPVP